MSEPKAEYVPAAGFDWLLPLYDPLTRLLGADRVLKQLVAHADLQPCHRVLDVGCGTGNLASVALAVHCDIAWTGIDPDPLALRRARAKARRRGVVAEFEEASCADLPFGSDSFDRVLSSFMVHHLDPDARTGMFSEARRVLRPGGRLHVVDFCGGDRKGFHTRLASLMGHDHAHEPNDAERFLSDFERAGFVDVACVDRSRTWVGSVAFFRGSVRRD